MDIRRATKPKAFAAIATVLGMGLKVSEGVDLKVSDIDSGRMQVLIDTGKGKKNQYEPLPTALWDLLREYYRAYRPETYFFKASTESGISSAMSTLCSSMR